MEHRSRFQRMAAWIGRHKWQFVVLFVGILGPLYAFGELAEDVRAGQAFAWDDPVLLYAHSLSSPWMDRVMLFFTYVGYGFGVIPLDVGILIALLVLRRWRSAFFFGLAVGGAALLNVGAKLAFGRVRPALWTSIAPETTFSFPSGHAMGSMALVAAICVLVWSTRWRSVALTLGGMFVVMVCLSRVYLGVHYPSDVLAGCMASLAWVMGLAMSFFGRTSRAPADETPLAADKPQMEQQGAKHRFVG